MYIWLTIWVIKKKINQTEKNNNSAKKDSFLFYSIGILNNYPIGLFCIYLSDTRERKERATFKLSFPINKNKGSQYIERMRKFILPIFLPIIPPSRFCPPIIIWSMYCTIQTENDERKKGDR